MRLYKSEDSTHNATHIKHTVHTANTVHPAMPKETHNEKLQRLQKLEMERNTNKSVLLILVTGVFNTALVVTVVPFIAVSMGLSGLIVMQAAMKVAGCVLEGWQGVAREGDR